MCPGRELLLCSRKTEIKCGEVYFRPLVFIKNGNIMFLLNENLDTLLLFKKSFLRFDFQTERNESYFQSLLLKRR